MSTTGVPSLPESTTSGLSEPQRILYTFTAPTATFEDIRRNASWWVPWLLISIVSLLFVFAVDRKIGWDQVVQNEIQKNPKTVEQYDKMNPDQRDRALNIQTTITRIMAYAYPIMTLIYFAVIAGLLLLLFNFGFGARLGFSRMMAIVTYGSLPLIVSSLLTVIIIFAGIDPEGFDIRNPVATNPGYFVEPSQRFLSGFLMAFDVIGIWIIFLIATGIAANSKVKRTTAFIAIFVAYFLWKTGAAAFGAM